MECEINIDAFFKQRHICRDNGRPILTVDHGCIQIRIRIIQ